MHKRGQRKTTLDNKDIDINLIICSNKMQFFNHVKNTCTNVYAQSKYCSMFYEGKEKDKR